MSDEKKMQLVPCDTLYSIRSKDRNSDSQNARHIEIYVDRNKRVNEETTSEDQYFTTRAQSKTYTESKQLVQENSVTNLPRA